MKLETACKNRKVHNVKDVPGDRWIASCAAHLKASGKFKLPPWVDVVKTSHAKELSPYDQDWLYVRGAALLRRISLRPDIGVGMLRKLYGGKKNKGSRPGHHVLAAGGIIRYCLQQFETMGLIEQTERGCRRLTSQGQREVVAIAKQVEL